MSSHPKYSSKLQNARILIIGGSSGLGFCVAEACLEFGAIVTISSSNEERVAAAVQRLVSGCSSTEARVFGVRVDLGDAETVEEEVRGLLETTRERNGGEMLDHVVFTAGDKLEIGGLGDLTMSKILAAGQIRFFAPLILAKYLPSYLNSSYKSSYTITTGVVAERPIPDWSVIASYAGGHHSMVRNLALDMKPIRVNGVSPGAVRTELWGDDGEEMMRALEEKMTTGRVGEAEDVAESFLACLRDANMSGAVVRTDGGQSLT
ncbi:hypothetical protein IAQ61_004781 [Plenodomus lingam]|uniref:uncharacterized protein n=1 Tax=Leptosphaeria maculans TaxID=5022 RepID=UPI003327B395|nr:hypothetical protein IAQ61_004781 [Plenodomus lingam]